MSIKLPGITRRQRQLLRKIAAHACHVESGAFAPFHGPGHLTNIREDATLAWIDNATVGTLETLAYLGMIETGPTRMESIEPMIPHNKPLQWSVKSVNLTDLGREVIGV